ncbi:MAG: hypothetical protein KC996_07075 [Phycisphaerales bacterium]|nr:hypothetical protein [Phycisphaerales bacterium]
MSHQPTARGFTMVETVLATLLVGTVLISTLSLVGPVMRTTELAQQQIIAQRLADELVDEIASQPFVDPSSSDSEDTLAPNTGERTSVRADFDDVDDYNGWIGFPPKEKDGTTKSGLTKWARQVKVEHVLAADLTTSSVSATGVKRIRVQVVRNGTLLAEEIIIRTSAWDDMRSGK